MHVVCMWACEMGLMCVSHVQCMWLDKAWYCPLRTCRRPVVTMKILLNHSPRIPLCFTSTNRRLHQGSLSAVLDSPNFRRSQTNWEFRSAYFEKATGGSRSSLLRGWGQWPMSSSPTISWLKSQTELLTVRQHWETKRERLINKLDIYREERERESMENRSMKSNETKLASTFVSHDCPSISLRCFVIGTCTRRRFDLTTNCPIPPFE